VQQTNIALAKDQRGKMTKRKFLKLFFADEKMNKHIKGMIELIQLDFETSFFLQIIFH